MVRLAMPLICAVAVTLGCTLPPAGDDTGADARRMQAAGAAYRACVAADAEKNVASPATAEEIAVAAHGRCWELWDHYRQATTAAYSARTARTEELQFAHDRVDAHLRQVELETRREVTQSVVQRAVTRRH